MPQRPSHAIRAIFQTSEQLSEDGTPARRQLGHLNCWFRRKSLTRPYGPINDFIASELGRYLRLPIPPISICWPEKGEPMFGSLDFNFENDQLPWVMPSYCWKYLPKLSTGVVLFDIWILNADRHEENLVVDEVFKPSRMVVFDQDLALFSGCEFENLQGPERLRILEKELAITEKHGLRHCLLDEITTLKHFEEWLHRIETVPEWVIHSICQESKRLGLSPTDAQAVAEFLVRRRNEIRNITYQHRHEFKSVPAGEWPQRLVQ